MYVQYGNYRHATGEAAITMAASAEFTDRGTLKGYRAVANISGVLLGSTQDELRTKAAELMQAYSLQGQFLGLYHDDFTLSHLYLDPAEANGGIRVTKPVSFPRGRGGGEYATGRTYEITVEAQYLSLQNSLLSFQESLSFQGNGGPRHAFFELMYGPPVRQQVSAQTLFRATQSGNAIGQMFYPPAPPPLWPQYLINPDSAITYTGGTLIGGGVFTGFGTAWNYQYVSDVPLQGVPTLS